MLLVVAIVAVPIVLVGAVALSAWFLVRNPGVPAQARPKLLVTRDADNKQHHYRSIQQALRVAQTGDVIELLDDVHEENLFVDPSKGVTEVTLKAARGQGGDLAAGQDRTEPIIKLSKAKNFDLKGEGITLDGTLKGGTKVKDLLTVMLQSPGLVVDGLKLKNYDRSAVFVANAAGERDGPIRLQNLHPLDPPVDKASGPRSSTSSPLPPSTPTRTITSRSLTSTSRSRSETAGAGRTADHERPQRARCRPPPWWRRPRPPPSDETRANAKAAARAL